MQAVLPLVRQLGEMRGLPQFLFAEPIFYPTTVAFRKALIAHKEKFPSEKEIDFVLHSPGGSPSDAYRIIRALRTNFEVVNIIVPFWAKSAATLMSLGASKIILNEWAEFGPIDIQVAKAKEDSPDPDFESALNDEFSLKLLEGRAQELFKTMFVDFHRSKNIPIGRIDLSKHLMDYLPKFYQPLLTQLNPYKLGEKKRQLDISVKYAQRILVQYTSLDERQRVSLTDYLLNECPEHGFVVDYEILALFLPNIHLAETVSPAYAQKLEEISLLCMEAKHDDHYLGFVYGIDPAPPDFSPTEVVGITDNSNGRVPSSPGPEAQPSKTKKKTNAYQTHQR